MEHIKTQEDWFEFLRQEQWAYQKAECILRMLHKDTYGNCGDIELDTGIVRYTFKTIPMQFDARWMLMPKEELKPIIEAHKAALRGKREEHAKAIAQEKRAKSYWEDGQEP